MALLRGRDLVRSRRTGAREFTRFQGDMIRLVRPTVGKLFAVALLALCVGVQLGDVPLTVGIERRLG